MRSLPARLAVKVADEMAWLGQQKSGSSRNRTHGVLCVCKGTTLWVGKDKQPGGRDEQKRQEAPPPGKNSKSALT